MAEFIEVWNAASRLCEATGGSCTVCPSHGNCIFRDCPNTDPRMAEEIILRWAAAHPAEPADKPADPAHRCAWKPILVQRHAGAAATTYWACSACGCVMTCRSNYCPNCGAKMGGDG